MAASLGPGDKSPISFGALVLRVGLGPIDNGVLVAHAYTYCAYISHMNLPPEHHIRILLTPQFHCWAPAELPEYGVAGFRSIFFNYMFQAISLSCYE